MLGSGEAGRQQKRGGGCVDRPRDGRGCGELRGRRRRVNGGSEMLERARAHGARSMGMRAVLVAGGRKARLLLWGAEGLLGSQLDPKVLVVDLTAIEGQPEHELHGLLVRPCLLAQVDLGVDHRRHHEPQRRQGGEQGRGAAVQASAQADSGEKTRCSCLRAPGQGGCTSSIGQRRLLLVVRVEYLS